MPHTRHLLLDCRAALRRTDPAFEDTPLGERLDAAILAIGQADDARRVEAQAAPGKPMAGRVAYAWQSVARELRHSHPDVYQRMSEQVLKRLDLDALDDPAEEIEALRKSLDTTEQARTRLEAEAAGLRDALAEAVARPPSRYHDIHRRRCNRYRHQHEVLHTIQHQLDLENDQVAQQDNFGV